MANTGSFPVALQATVTTRPAPWSGEKHDDARVLGFGLIGLFVLGSGAAAAGFQLESQGYGSLTLVGGALIGIATAIPAWLLFRRPRGAKAP